MALTKSSRQQAALNHSVMFADGERLADAQLDSPAVNAKDLHFPACKAAPQKQVRVLRANIEIRPS